MKSQRSALKVIVGLLVLAILWDIITQIRTGSGVNFITLLLIVATARGVYALFGAKSSN